MYENQCALREQGEKTNQAPPSAPRLLDSTDNGDSTALLSDDISRRKSMRSKRAPGCKRGARIDWDGKEKNCPSGAQSFPVPPQKEAAETAERVCVEKTAHKPVYFF